MNGNLNKIRKFTGSNYEILKARTHLRLALVRKKLSFCVKMASVMASLPLHLLCQLIMPNVTANNDNYGYPAVNQLPQQQSVIQQLPEGYVEYPGQGVAYKFHTDVELTWINARQLCVSEGAHLAVIDTREKVQYVAKFHPGDTFHVGFYSAYDDDKEWVSVTSGGEPISNLPWKTNEPDYEYKCTTVTQTGLETHSCSHFPSHFVCERPIPPHVSAVPQNRVLTIAIN